MKLRLASFATRVLQAERNASHADLDAKYDAESWFRQSTLLESIIQSMHQSYNPGADPFDTVAALEALRSSRTKGETP